MVSLKELILLLTTDAITYSRVVTSRAVMQAEAEAAKTRITLVTLEYQQKLARAARDAARRQSPKKGYLR